MNSHKNAKLKLKLFFEKPDLGSLNELLSLMDCGTDLTQLVESDISEEFSDTYYSQLKEYFDKRKGLVYLAAIPDKENLFKIGMTSKSAIEREKTLKAEGLLVPPRIVFSVEVNDRFFAEKTAHKLASSFSITREFFCSDYFCLENILKKSKDLDTERFNKLNELRF